MKAWDGILTFAVRFAEMLTPTPNKDVVLQNLQAFLSNVSDRKSAGWLVTHPMAVKDFFRDHLELLTAPERFQLYGMMEGFFPHCFMDVLTSRLAVESDDKCLELLRVIGKMQGISSPRD